MALTLGCVAASLLFSQAPYSEPNLRVAALEEAARIAFSLRDKADVERQILTIASLMAKLDRGKASDILKASLYGDKCTEHDYNCEERLALWHLALIDFESSQAYVDGIRDKDRRGDLRAATLDALALSRPREALSLSRKWFGPSPGYSLFDEVAAGLARLKLNDVLSIIEGESRETQERFLNSLASKWSDSEPEKAFQLLPYLKSSYNQDEVKASVAPHILLVDLNRAESLVESIGENWQRVRAYAALSKAAYRNNMPQAQEFSRRGIQALTETDETEADRLSSFLISFADLAKVKDPNVLSKIKEFSASIQNASTMADN